MLATSRKENNFCVSREKNTEVQKSVNKSGPKRREKHKPQYMIVYLNIIMSLNVVWQLH